jgi:AAA domain
MAAEWSTDVIAEAERWIAEGGGAGRTATWVELGRAVPHDDGRLVVDLRDRRSGDTFLDHCFAGGQGPEHERAYPVEELRDEDGVLLLQPPEGLPEDCRHLWARSVSPVEGLLDGLRVAGPAPLAQALAEKRLAGAPTSGVEAEGLVGAEVEAFRACLSPGVRLVWTPPGTGEAYVLARAIEALVAEGKRVLLVSRSSDAVDEALDAALRRMSPQLGVAVRVGPSQLAEDVRAERLATRAVAAELRDIEEIRRLRAELGDYDESAYRAAAARLAAQHALDELRPRLREAEAAADAARRAAVTAATELREALDAQEALGPVRDALEHDRRAVDGLAALEQRQRAVQDERDALLTQERPGWGARRRHRRQVEAAEAELVRFAAVAAEGRRRWLDVRLHARAVAGGRTQPDVDDADLRAAAAEQAVVRADGEYRRARELLNGLRTAVDAAKARGLPTDDDRLLVADTEARSLPVLQARLRELADLRDDAATEALDARRRELVGRGPAMRADAEARIVQEAQVVATTLARSRTHPALADAAFDVVLVEEAGAAALAEVLLVLCRATSTAVLFGDFLQLRANHGRDGATCFSHLGIEAPADVDAHEGCVALTQQSRFGAALRRLADETLYERLGDAAERHTDIVLIDVSTVPDLAAVRLGAVEGRWWSAAGAVLSLALAERHQRDGRVAVVAANAVQADVTLAVVRDHGMITGTAVGPVCGLQGREFPTVVFDLVAGDGGPRTFGAGITLARDRLYLVADATAVRAAGGPLRDAVERGEVRTWSAAALLGMAEPPVDDDPIFTEVGALLRKQVTVTDREPQQHLAAAQRSVWMWSPWSADVVPLLQAAARRGVQVRVFARRGEDVPMAAVVRSDHEYGHLMVVDEQVVLLANGESAIAVDGPAFAGRVLAELQAEWTGEPRTCGRCGETMEVRRGGTADVQWRCSHCRIRVPEFRHEAVVSPA